MFAVGFGRFFGGFCAVVAGAGTAVAIGACGHLAVAQTHHVAVSEMEYRLRPNHILVPGGTLTVAVHNYGRLTHNFEIARLKPVTTTQTTTTGVETLTSTVAARTSDLTPGASATITVTLPAGRYGIASVLGNDQGQGMQGSLTVASK